MTWRLTSFTAARCIDLQSIIIDRPIQLEHLGCRINWRACGSSLTDLQWVLLSLLCLHGCSHLTQIICDKKWSQIILTDWSVPIHLECWVVILLPCMGIKWREGGRIWPTWNGCWCLCRLHGCSHYLSQIICDQKWSQILRTDWSVSVLPHGD